MTGVRRTAGLVCLALLGAAGLAAAWWRLDLISFRYDQAEALRVARQAFAGGGFPFAGIVNSVGFANPPLLPWVLMPAMAVSFQPDAAAAWFALLHLAALPALYLLGRRLLAGWAWVVPASIGALSVFAIMGARSLWAQHLLIPLGAWALVAGERWLAARGEGRTDSRALVWWTVLNGLCFLMHLAAALLLVSQAVLVAWGARRVRLARGEAGAALGVLAIVAVVGAPSLLDGLDTAVRGRAEPAWAAEYRAGQDEAPSLARRLVQAPAHAVTPVLTYSVTGGIERGLSAGLHRWVLAHDALLVGLVLAGFGVLTAGWLARRRSGARADLADTDVRLTALVLAVAALPCVIGSVAFARINPTYFYSGLPVVWLAAGRGCALAALLLRGAPPWLMPVAVALVVAVTGPAVHITGVLAVERAEGVADSYYIPLRFQRAMAEELRASGVSASGMQHLSGPWYGRPYEYLLLVAAPAPAPAPQVALVEDLMLRQHEPRASAVIESLKSLQVGSVVAILRRDAEEMRGVLREVTAVARPDSD